MATDTAIEVVMPQMGVSVSEGTVTRWLKQEGEHVEADEPLLEISTDKVDTEVPSPASGTSREILVREGETVDVGTNLARSAAASRGAAPPSRGRARAGRGCGAGAAPRAEPPAPLDLDARSTPQPAPASPGRERHVRLAGRGADRVRARRRPVAGRGTGRGGRVTKKDILDYIESGAAAAAPAPAAA